MQLQTPSPPRVGGACVFRIGLKSCLRSSSWIAEFPKEPGKGAASPAALVAPQRGRWPGVVSLGSLPGASGAAVIFAAAMAAGSSCA